MKKPAKDKILLSNMKCIILAGGMGTRISEESGDRPKPMVEIGRKPVLWHVMRIYSAHGIRDFIICTGLKGHVIKEYFANYFLHMSDVTSDIWFADGEMNRLYRDYRGTDYTALREKYEPGYSLRNRALQGEVKYGQLIDSFLAPFISKQALSILDYGGDSGKNTPFRHRARQHDIYDISNNTVVSGARAVSRKQAIEKYYDLIVCSNVLEHVPYPSGLLEDIRRIVRPETVLYVEVSFEDVMRDYPETAIAHKKHWHEHINFFSTSAVHSLLSNLGFKIKAFHAEAIITVGLKSSYMMQVACDLSGSLHKNIGKNPYNKKTSKNNNDFSPSNS